MTSIYKCYWIRGLDVIITAEITLGYSEDIGVGVGWGGVSNHIKGFMLYPLKDQRVGSLNALKFKVHWEQALVSIHRWRNRWQGGGS